MFYDDLKVNNYMHNDEKADTLASNTNSITV